MGVLVLKGYIAQLQIGSGIIQSEVNDSMKGCGVAGKHYLIFSINR